MGSGSRVESVHSSHDRVRGTGVEEGGKGLGLYLFIASCTTTMAMKYMGTIAGTIMNHDSDKYAIIKA